MKKLNNQGFSIVDLLVSMSIVTLIMSVVLFSYRTFGNKLAVSSASQEIAVAVRHAQVYGTSVKEVSKGGGDFNTGYGVSFDTNTPGQYYIFVDRNHNGIYDGDSSCTPGGECIVKNTIRNSAGITKLCGIDSAGVQTCPPAGATGVSIVFPPSQFQASNPDATITFTNSGGTLPGTYTGAIIVTSLGDAVTQTTVQSSVTVSQTGQTYVQDLPSIPTNNHPPVITLLGSASMTIITGSTFTDPGATATDIEDGDLTASIVKTGTVNTLIPGVYKIKYDVKDSGGLNATTVKRTVTVVSSCNPTIAGSTISGNNPFAFPYSISVVGNYAYIVNTNVNNFQIFNITDPTNPVSVATIPTMIAPHALRIVGSYAYVVSDAFSGSTLQIYDITNPVSPVTLSTLAVNTQQTSQSYMDIQSNYVYITSQKDNTLKIYNVSNPASPTLVSTISTGALPSQVSVVGNYAYITTVQSKTFEVYNISNPALPVSVATVPAGSIPNRFSISGNYAYVTNSLDNTLQVFNISNPALPVSVATVAGGTSPLGISVQGIYAFITNYIAGTGTLKIFDVSIPATPVLVGTASTGSAPIDVVAKNNYAYVINATTNELQVFNLTCF